MPPLSKLVLASEDWLIKRIHFYVTSRGYDRYSSTLEEAWRLSIRTLSALVAREATESGETPAEFGPEDDFMNDAVASFGIVEAQRHRERGIGLGMFMSLLKYYRQSYLDLISEQGYDRGTEERMKLLVIRLYDRLEIGISLDWSAEDPEDRIEELRAANRFLTNEKNKYLTLVESLSAPVLLLDADNRIDNINRAAAALLGRSGHPGSEYYCLARDRAGEYREAEDGPESGPGADAKCLQQESLETLLPWLGPAFKAFRENRRGHTQLETEAEVSGQVRWFEVVLTPMLDISGKFGGTIVVLRDITGRRHAEEGLRRSEREKDLVLNATSEMFAHYDLDLRLQWANRASGESVGEEAEALIGRHCYEIWHQRSDPCPGCPLLVVRETGRPQQSEITSPDGRHWLLRGYPVLDETGQVVSLVEFGQEITRQKTEEAERKKLEGQLHQAQKMESVGRLAGGVAHDFNNMLGVILGHAEMALDNIGPDHPLREPIVEIERAAGHSAKLTRQLLAFARKQTISPKVLDVNETVEGMLKMLRRLIGEDIQLQWIPGPGLWPVRIDPAQVDQILANLCVNARDAITGVGKVTIETANVTHDHVYCEDHEGFLPGDFVLLAVSDDGCGMDRETLDHLFEPFFTTKEGGRGTGLGLATVYGIVKQNEGFINAYSEPGRGSTFRIYLPRHAGDSVPAHQVPRPARDRGGRETVLLVEDEPALLNLGRMMLERLGYRVLAADSPEAALRLASEHAGEIHLLMTDVVMPEMNGRDLARRLTSLYPDLKSLFMSGYTANVIAHHGVLEEGVHFIQKPFSRRDLAGKVREVLDAE